MNLDKFKEYKSTGSKALLNQLVKEEMPLVQHCVNRFTKGRYPEDQEDLRQDASIGLLRALQLWDPAKGRPWASFASSWIWIHMKKSIVDGALFKDKSSRNRRVLSDVALGTEPIEDGFDMTMAYDDPGFEEVERSLDAEKALNALDDESRRLVTSLFFDNKTIREVSKDEGLSRSLVALRKKQALDRMRKRDAA